MIWESFYFTDSFCSPQIWFLVLLHTSLCLLLSYQHELYPWHNCFVLGLRATNSIMIFPPSSSFISLIVFLFFSMGSGLWTSWFDMLNLCSKLPTRYLQTSSDFTWTMMLSVMLELFCYFPGSFYCPQIWFLALLHTSLCLLCFYLYDHHPWDNFCLRRQGRKLFHYFSISFILHQTDCFFVFFLWAVVLGFLSLTCRIYAVCNRVT